MKKLAIVLAALAASIALAVPAFAEPPTNTGTVVCAPAQKGQGDPKAKDAQGPPPPEIKAVLPDNQGTEKAVGHSPVIINSNGDRGDLCTPN